MKKQTLLKLLVVSMVAALLLAAASPVFSAAQKVRVFVEFTPGGKAAVQKALTGVGAEFHYTFDHLNAFVVTLPEQALNGLAKNPNVVDVEEDALRYPIMSSLNTDAMSALGDVVSSSGDTVPYGVDAVQARDVWDVNMDGDVDAGALAGAGVKVCIIDTGYYGDHEDLPDLTATDGMSQVDDNFYRDGYGHGSHVAGTIAGQDNDLGVIGVAPNVSFYIVKYFGDDGAATYASDLIAASTDCAANGADIISMSLGGTRGTNREMRNFDTLYAQGVLSIAAAGNDGNTAYSYPASYDSVVSVAAVDEANVIADFSQQNDQVEVAAPGVAVLSTLPYMEENYFTVEGVDYQANHIEYSATGSTSGALVDGGLCTSSGSWSGAVVLCERGDISFYDKVMNVQNGGGAAAVIYNNEPGNFLGTLGEGASSTIIGLSLSQEDGAYLVASKLGATASLSSIYTWPASGYEAWDGTSMATPHVSAVAALLWSEVPTATNAEIREAMSATAMDLGTAGYDVAFGYGLVQAADALAYLGGGTPPTNTAPVVDITAPVSGTSVEDGTAITFAATATDAEDGDLSADITWASSLDGALGTGASVTATLSVGTHTIIASATDSGSLTGSDSITVTVTDGGTGGALVVSVSTNAPSYGDRVLATIIVDVTDGSAPVENASVEGTMTTASGNVKTFSGLTDANGQAFFTYKTFVRKDGTGTYTVDVVASAAGYEDGTGSTTFLVQ
jgi:subtilisin family serine protease